MQTSENKNKIKHKKFSLKTVINFINNLIQNKITIATIFMVASSFTGCDN